MTSGVLGWGEALFWFRLVVVTLWLAGRYGFLLRPHLLVLVAIWRFIGEFMCQWHGVYT